MYLNVKIPAKTARRFAAALGWTDQIGDSEPLLLDEQVNKLINLFVEESGVPCMTDGEPIDNAYKTVEFVYNKGELGTVPKWRTVHVVEETDKYIKGYEDGEFKCFCRSKIVGGRVIEV